MSNENWEMTPSGRGSPARYKWLGERVECTITSWNGERPIGKDEPSWMVFFYIEDRHSDKMHLFGTAASLELAMELCEVYDRAVLTAWE